MSRGNAKLEVGQLVLTSSTPPGNLGLYAYDQDTIGVVGDLVCIDPKSKAESSVVTSTVDPVTGGVEISGPSGYPTLILSKLSAIKTLLDAAYDEGETVKYIVSGDSTRENYYSDMYEYYTYMLNKCGVTVVNNAQNGVKGVNWYNGTGAVTMAQAIAASGDGTGVILEYSFGINDYGTDTLANVKNNFILGIRAYMAACPNALVVLATPVYTANSAQNVDLKATYQQISSELNLPLVDVQGAISTVHGDSAYYWDSTHPNRYGSARIVNYILDRILPSSLYSVVDMNAAFFTTPAPPNTDNLAGAVEVNYWNSSTGAAGTASTWRRLPTITVTAGYILRVKHQGNKRDVICMTSNDSVTLAYDEDFVDGWQEILLPPSTVKVRINVSSQGSTYDALNPADVPEVRYKASTPSELTIAEINTGLTVRLASA